MRDVAGVATQRAASAREPYFDDRLVEQLLLIRRGTPAAVDVELDPVAAGIRRRLAERTEQSWIKLGHGRVFVVENRHAVRDLAVGEAKRTAASCAWPGSAGTPAGRRREPVARRVSGLLARWADAVDGDEPDSERQPRTPTSAATTTTGSRVDRVRRPAARCWLVIGHACQSRQRGVASAYADFRYADDMRPLSSIEPCACWSSRTSPTWQRPSATACGWRRSRPTSPATATPPWSCWTSTPTTSPSSTATSRARPATRSPSASSPPGTGMPILMLTAADRLDDKASGFELGADDYLTKPFELQELVLRLRALDRRRAHTGRPCARSPACDWIRSAARSTATAATSR